MESTNTSIHASLVMTYCSGDLRWLKNYTMGFDFDYTFVAMKCGIEPDRDALPKGAELVHLPNVGGCDHTMAYWMSEVLPTLPRRGTPGVDNEEVVLFLKDAINNRKKTTQRDFQTLLDHALSDQAFGCLYLYDNRAQWRFYEYTNIVRKFGVRGYAREVERQGVTEDAQVPFKSSYPNAGAWQDAMNMDMPRPILPACYGGMYMVKRSRIERVPLDIFRNVTQSLSRGNNIEEGHFAERSWAGLFMDKDYVKKATIGMVKETTPT